MYRLFTTESDQELLGCMISSMYYLATLEIVVDDGTNGPCMLLTLGSYALDDTVKMEHGEGYWVPPNIAYPVAYTDTRRLLPTVVCAFGFESAVTRRRVTRDVQQLAYSLGLRATLTSSTRAVLLRLRTRPGHPN